MQKTIMLFILMFISKAWQPKRTNTYDVPLSASHNIYVNNQQHNIAAGCDFNFTRLWVMSVVKILFNDCDVNIKIISINVSCGLVSRLHINFYTLIILLSGYIIASSAHTAWYSLGISKEHENDGIKAKYAPFVIII